MNQILLSLLWLLAALPFILIFLILLAVLYASYSLKKDTKKLANALCLKCGKPIGEAAVLEAQERARQEVSEMQNKNPYVRLRLVITWLIICPHCTHRMQYSPSGEQELISEKI